MVDQGVWSYVNSTLFHSNLSDFAMAFYQNFSCKNLLNIFIDDRFVRIFGIHDEWTGGKNSAFSY